MTNLIEVDRQKIVNIGGSPYVLIPRALRHKYNATYGDAVSFHQAEDFEDTVIRIEKPSSEEGAN